MQEEMKLIDSSKDKLDIGCSDFDYSILGSDADEADSCNDEELNHFDVCG